MLLRFQAFLLEQLAYQDAKFPREPSELMDWQPDETQGPPWTCPPAPQQESSETLLLELHRRNQQIRELREELEQKEASPTSPPSPHTSSPACFSVQMKISELETRTRTRTT